MTMQGPYKFEDPRTVLRRHGLAPKHSWGQNFLISQGAVASIAEAAVDKSDCRIIEIGPGLGTLTGALLGAGGRVTALERDREMCAVLRVEFGGMDRFLLVETDAVKFDYASFLADEPAVIVGNLPYQLTGRLLRVILQCSDLFLRAVLMVQAEVADRLIAPPGERQRSALSVFCQARCEARVIRRLRPTAFHPPPKVRSAVVTLTPREESIFNDRVLESDFERVVRAAFSAKRKTLRNALVNGGIGSPDQVEGLLEEAGIAPGVRPARLTVEDFATLAGVWGRWAAGA
jgi:16S rRNA (adenine1518-N6/adenine1519-N6)-dimethyltransferase